MDWLYGKYVLRRFRHRGLSLRGLADSPNYSVTKPDQIMLMLRYRELFHAQRDILSFREIGFRAFSQTDEDGILLYLLSLTGMPTRKCIEICAGEGVECNTANLLVNHGYHGLLVDGIEENVEFGSRYYRELRDTTVWPPIFLHKWVKTSNVNSLILDAGFEGEIDVLSLDVDGVDYWIWKEITEVRPRIVVLEYYDLWGAERAVTVPYSDQFNAVWFEGYPGYAGASLPAFVKLGRQKGYRLVGCNQYGYNAFFLRNDVGVDVFPEVAVEQCLVHPKNHYRRKERLDKALKFPWVEV
ncbi:MAG: hypothetical protein ACRD19_05850 [Terriglobia bacterium]